MSDIGLKDAGYIYGARARGAAAGRGSGAAGAVGGAGVTSRP